MAFKELIEFFDRSYIINLKDRTDRRRGVGAEFRAIGMEVPGDKVSFYSASRPTAQGDFYSIGAKGSFSSHRNVLRLAAEAGLKNVLVFEDDLSFRRIHENMATAVLAAVQKVDWDVIYFGYLEPKSPALTGPLAPWPHDTLGGHWYGVNGHFIDTMVQYMDECELAHGNHPNGGPISRDGAFNHIRYLSRIFECSSPFQNLGLQRSSRTDIAPVKFFDLGQFAAACD